MKKIISIIFIIFICNFCFADTLELSKKVISHDYKISSPFIATVTTGSELTTAITNYTNSDRTEAIIYVTGALSSNEVSISTSISLTKNIHFKGLRTSFDSTTGSSAGFTKAPNSYLRFSASGEFNITQGINVSFEDLYMRNITTTSFALYISGSSNVDTNVTIKNCYLENYNGADHFLRNISTAGRVYIKAIGNYMSATTSDDASFFSCSATSGTVKMFVTLQDNIAKGVIASAAHSGANLTIDVLGGNKFDDKGTGLWWQDDSAVLVINKSRDVLASTYTGKSNTISFYDIYDSISSDQSIVAGTGLTILKPLVRVAGSGGAVTVTSTPNIKDGSDGQIIIIQGTSDTDTVEFQDESSLASSGLALAGGVDFTLGIGDTLQLIYDSGDDKWYEISRSNN